MKLSKQHQWACESISTNFQDNLTFKKKRKNRVFPKKKLKRVKKISRKFQTVRIVMFMVKAYGLVVITCIIIGPFDNESTKTSNGHVRCRYVCKESSPNFQCQIKQSFNHTICEFCEYRTLRNMLVVSQYKTYINVK